jgi:nucleoside-diphosphate-sugar epimerase
VQCGDGMASRNYIYVHDAAHAIVHALENDIQGVHLLAGSETLSISEMLQEICNVFIPGKNQLVIEGVNPRNQLIESSAVFPLTRSFREALLHISQEAAS